MAEKLTTRLVSPRRVGERWEYIDLVFWPEHGIIYIEDKEDGEFTTCLRPDWVARILMFQQQCDRLRQIIDRTGNIGTKQTLIEEWHVTMDLVEAMRDVNRRAKAQGDPTDETVQKHMRTHKTTATQSIIVPGEVTPQHHKKLILPGQ